MPETDVDFPDEAMVRLHQAAVDRLRIAAQDYPNDKTLQDAWREVKNRSSRGGEVVQNVVMKVFRNFLKERYGNDNAG